MFRPNKIFSRLSAIFTAGEVVESLSFELHLRLSQTQHILRYTRCKIARFRTLGAFFCTADNDFDRETALQRTLTIRTTWEIPLQSLRVCWLLLACNAQRAPPPLPLPLRLAQLQLNGQQLQRSLPLPALLFGCSLFSLSLMTTSVSPLARGCATMQSQVNNQKNELDQF